MILTCPECATSYFVDDSRIPEGGRTVKCTNCGARWHTAREAQGPDPEPELFDEPEAAPTPVAAPEPEPVAAVAPDDDLDVSGPEPEPATKLRRTPPPPAKKPTGAIIAWGAMAAVVVALVAGALIFRDSIVHLAPQTSGAYAGLGVPVNSLGLVIEDVEAKPTFQGGRPVLAVTGKIRNLRHEAAQSPAIRVDMLTRTGRLLAARIVRPIDPQVPAGATRHFAVAIPDPPSSLGELALAFETPGGGHAAPAAVHAEAVAPAEGGHGAAAGSGAGHGSEPSEAQPLPADAPDALSDHHG